MMLTRHQLPDARAPTAKRKRLAACCIRSERTDVRNDMHQPFSIGDALASHMRYRSVIARSVSPGAIQRHICQQRGRGMLTMIGGHGVRPSVRGGLVARRSWVLLLVSLRRGWLVAPSQCLL